MTLFTVFTPTYNRAHTLPRLYESIRRQTCRDFEWVIVDDGSTDRTRELVESWKNDRNDFQIRYFWQPNQHKKVAFNRGVREARGRWFVPIDSDDELLTDTLEQFRRMWESIPDAQRELFYGVVGLCIDDEGQIVGDRFPCEPLDATSVELWFDYCLAGEKFAALSVAALRTCPFPEGIKDLVPENVVWFRLSRRYKQRCFNIPVRIYHRDVESITLPADPVAARARRAEGALLYYAEALDWVTWRRVVRSPVRVLFMAVQHGRWWAYLPSERRRFHPQRLAARLLVICSRPIGWLLYRLDRARLTARLRDALSARGTKFW